MKAINEMSLQELADYFDSEYSVYGMDLNYCADRLRELHKLTRWIPVSERLPTQEDANEHGGVFVHAIQRHGNPSTNAWYWDAVTEIGIGSHKPTHWRRIDKP